MRPALLLPLLLAAPLQAETVPCKKLKAAAADIKLSFATSDPNLLNCGAAGSDSSNYVLPGDPSSQFELHVVGVYEGSFPAQTGATGKDAPETSVRVVVYKTKKPAVLVLSAGKPVIWDVTLNQSSNVSLIILQGGGEQKLRGVSSDIPVFHRSLEKACGYGYAWEKGMHVRGEDFRTMIQGIRCATGMRENSFQGCFSGAVFEIPHYRQDKKAKAPPVDDRPTLACPFPVEPDIPLGGAIKTAGSPEQPQPDPVRAVITRPEPVRRPTRLTPEPAMPESTPEPAPRQGTPESLGASQSGLTRPERTEQGDASRHPVTRQMPRSTVEALNELGDKSDLPAPEGTAPRQDIPVRALAILLEGKTTLLTHDAVPDLVQALQKGDDNLRFRAADALGQVRPPATEAVEPLIKSLKDRSDRVRSSSALALGNIGPGAEKAVRLLKKALRDKNADVRYSAATALERIGTEKALRALDSYKED